MLFAQGHNAVTPVRLEPVASQSRVKHSTTELPSVCFDCMLLEQACLSQFLVFFYSIPYPLIWKSYSKNKLKIMNQINKYNCGLNLNSQIHLYLHYSKTCVKRSLENIRTKILITKGSLMKVKSIAECSPWSILQHF